MIKYEYRPRTLLGIMSVITPHTCARCRVVGLSVCCHCQLHKKSPDLEVYTCTSEQGLIFRGVPNCAKNWLPFA